MGFDYRIPSVFKKKWKKNIDLFANLSKTDIILFQSGKNKKETLVIFSEGNPFSSLHPDEVENLFTSPSKQTADLKKEVRLLYWPDGEQFGWIGLFFHNEKDNSHKNWLLAIGSYLETGLELIFQSHTSDIPEPFKSDFSNIMQNARDIIYRMVIPSGRYEYISPSVFEITGYPAEDFYNDPALFSHIMHADWKKYLDEQMNNLLKGIMPDSYEYQIVRKDGETRWICQNNVLIRDEKGNPAAIEGIARDNTDFRRKEEIANIQKELSLKLFEKNTVHSITGEVFKSALRITGMDSGGVYLFEKETGWLKLTEHKGHSEKFIGQVSEYAPDSENVKMVLEGKPFYGGFPFVSRKKIYDEENLKSFAIIPIFGLRKKIIGCINIASHSVYDIPLTVREGLETIVRYAGQAIERAFSDTELQKSEERYRLLVENSGSVTWTTDKTGKIIFISSNIEKITGYTADEMLAGHSDFWRTLIHPSDLLVFTGAVTRLLEEKIPYGMDLRIRKKNGEWMWVHNKADVFENPKGNMYAFGSFTDITGLKNVQFDLKQERDRAKNYFNIAGVILVSLNKKGKIEAINRKGCEILGYSENELIGRTWFDFIPAQNRAGVKKLFTEIIEGKSKGTGYFENSIVNGRGEERLIAWNNTIITDKEGNISGTLSSGEDITERKQNQQKLFNAVIHAEEEERSRIAKDLHDGVSPVLSTLKLYVQSLVMSKDEKLKENLISRISDTINETISSIKEISNNLSPHILHNFGYVVAVQSFINRLHDIRHVQFEFDTDFEGRFDEKIEITLYRVTIELINNTLKHANAKKIYIHFNKNSHFVVHYEDDGKGFDPEKVVTEKRGMGLYNMQNRIHSLNGEIIVKSGNGSGTKIDIIIPADDV